MATQSTNGQQTNGHRTNGAGRYVPRGASGIGVHDMVPELGYREYWYPAVLPEEQASAIAFLASDDASFITGQVINCSGGQS